MRIRPKNNHLHLVFAALVTAAFPGLLAAQSSVELDRGRDLESVQEWIDRERGFPPGNRDAAQALLDSLTMTPASSEVVHYLNVARVVAHADNAHSTLTTFPVWVEFGQLPIRPYWFSDGWTIVRARNEHRDLLGTTITHVEGIEVDVLAEVLRARYVGGPIQYFKEFKALPLMQSPAVLHAAGLAPSPDSLTITVRSSDGSSSDVRLAADLRIPRPGTGTVWRHLISEPLQFEEDWSTVDVSGEVMFGLRDHDQLFRYRHLPDVAVSYIQLRSNIGRNGIRIEDFIDSVRDSIDQHRPRNIILDNRFNGGGNLRLTARFALSLPELIPDEGRILVLTGPGTFSAGIYTSFYPAAADPDRTIVIGTRVGDRDEFWAESRGPLTTESTEWWMGYSLQKHNPVDGCDDRSCHLRGDGDMNLAVGSLDPEIVVPFGFHDYLIGRDKAVERALAIVAELSS